LHFTVGNVDERGDIAAQIKQGVHFDCSFATARTRPREQTRHKPMIVESNA
jgi:hypothetical protein